MFGADMWPFEIRAFSAISAANSLSQKTSALLNHKGCLDDLTPNDFDKLRGVWLKSDDFAHTSSDGVNSVWRTREHAGDFKES